ncbi:MAG: REP-associated tyrosine transposase [Endomicrobiales bacterium]
MPRHKRLEIPGAIYHVITRGIERRRIFCDDHDREEFLRRFSEGLSICGCKCYGWVLMPNHFHLLVQTGTKSLSDLMRKVLTGYALYFNRRHHRRGYLYQNRYKSILCQEEAYLLELVRYIHLNPLRANLVNSIQALNNYPWSGHSVIIGNHKREWQSTDEVLERFGEARRQAIEKYENYIINAKEMGQREDLSGGGLRRSAGGWEGVMELRRNREYWRGDERILGDGDFVNKVLKISEEELVLKQKLKKAGWDIHAVVKRVCELMGVKEDEIKRRSRGNNISKARSVIIYLSHKELGVKGKELSDYFGINKSSVSESIARGAEIVKTNNHYRISELRPL